MSGPTATVALMDLKSDESADARLEAVELLDALLDRPLTEMSVDELMALKAAYAARGIRIYNSVPWEVVAPLVAATGIYTKAFLESLAKHNAEALLDAVHAWVSKNKKGETIAFLAAADGDEIAKFVVTGDLPDAARLALLDLEVVSEALRGKTLRWDEKALAWRPDSG
jgi:hypothetical protein